MNTDTDRSKLPLLLAGAAIAAVLAIPALIVVAGIAAVSASATTSAAAVCTYAYPNADRIADTMDALTADPVQADQWDRYAHLAGIDSDTTTWESSTPAQRDEVLDAAVRSLLYTNMPAAISAPPISWWYGRLPVDDNDTTWQTTPVPGWDGDLEDYLVALVDTYASDDLNDGVGEHTCIPPAVTACPQPVNTDAILATIRHLESGDDYTEHHRSIAAGGPAGSGHPSGAYQFLASTWAGYGGYDEAFQAPPAIQDQRAASDVATILARFGGDPAWVPVAWYVGLSGAQRVADGEWSPAYVPNPAHNTISIGDYQARWLDYYATIALPTAGGEPAECPLGGLAAVAWAETQIGAAYAAIDPYRFGTPAWPGGTQIGSRGNVYAFRAGTVVYDCSGFVIAAWRAAGVDLVAQYGLYGSQAFPSSPLEEIPRTAVAPGDLAVYSPINGVGHIVMIHHVDPEGVVHTIEAVGGAGVTMRKIDWSRVTSIKRPPTPRRRYRADTDRWLHEHRDHRHVDRRRDRPARRPELGASHRHLRTTHGPPGADRPPVHQQRPGRRQLQPRVDRPVQTRRQRPAPVVVVQRQLHGPRARQHRRPAPQRRLDLDPVWWTRGYGVLNMAANSAGVRWPSAAWCRWRL